MVKERNSPRQPFFFLGHHPALDFLNTRPAEKGRLVERLEGFPALVAWLAEAKLLGAGETGEAIQRWGRSAVAHQALLEARRLRAALREAVEQLRRRRSVPAATLERINRLLRRKQVYAQVVRRGGGVVKESRWSPQSPLDLLALVAEAAAHLLTEADPALIRKCANPACVLYFYDTTKNRARRWCSMAGCGNRMKVTAFYRRQRARR